MRFEPNAPCPCGSGRKYKKCHRAFEEAPPHEKYGAAQGVYAESWRRTSELQAARGDYAWMAEQLAGHKAKRLFDIGTGSGHGLLALSAYFGPDLRIVGVDENLACLKMAGQTLANAGLPAQVVARLETEQTQFGFVQRGGAISIPLPKPVALVEADPLTDEHLEEALVQDGPFDLVTIWLTGAHMWRRYNAYSLRRGAKSEHDLRIILQNEAYELADRILRPGGLLQVIDRAEAPTTDAVRDEYFAAHGDQAEPTSLVVKDVTYRLWQAPEGAPTQLVNSMPDARPDDFPEAQLALVSIISEKA